EVRERLGTGTQIVLDGGIMSSTEMVAAIALGADAVSIGRAYLYGIMAGGQRGVEKVVELLRQELETTMKLMGCTSFADLTPAHVRILDAATARPAARSMTGRAR